MTTALCHGCFDILHVGHVRLLRHARELADRVVVSLLADRYVAKGLNRPIFPLAVREEAIRAIRYVDDVVVVDGPHSTDVERVIAKVAPDFYVKGADCRGRMPEQEFCERMGIKVEFFELAVFGAEKASTTQSINYLELYSW
jgi:cytidyltransferase-like protein